MRRLIKGLSALVALVLLVAGIPAALVLLGQPLPHHLSWARAVSALQRPDDGSILVGLITLVGWLAWLVFAVSLVIELVHLASGFRIRIALPGLGGPQRLVGGLLLSVVTMLAVPAASFAGPGLPPAVTTATAPVQGHDVTGSSALSAELSGPPARHTSARSGTAPASLLPTVPSAATGVPAGTHQVKPGDDLWSLAERYYGQGRDWRKIAAANPGVLSGGPDRLQPGWRLSIPGLAVVEPKAESEAVTVHAGDTLSSIARQVYGHESQWRDIFDANRAQISDPDEIQPGTRLQVPASKRSATAGGTTRDSKGTSPPTASPEPPAAPPGNGLPRVEHGGTRPAEPQPSGHASPEVSPTPGPSAEPSPVEPSPAEPSPPGPSPDATTSTASPPASAGQPSAAAGGPDSVAQTALGVGMVGGLLAASVLGGLALRRRTQLHARPVGRRIPHPPPPAQAVETALGQRQSPVGLRTLDLALRAIAAHCHRVGVPLPSLALVKVGSSALELVFTGLAAEAPVGFQVAGQSWLLQADDADYLASVPGVDSAARPYPGLATLGQDDEGNQVLLDLEACGLLALHSADRTQAEAVLAALAVELSFSPWADELALTLVGSSTGLPEALGKHNVTETEAVDALLNRLEQRAEVQRAHQPHEVLGRHRVDPDLAEPWVPEIVLIAQALTEQQSQRLVALTTGRPRVPVAAVVADPEAVAPYVLELAGPARDSGVGDQGSSDTAVLQPLGLKLLPQLLPAPVREGVLDLVSTTGSTQTTPAPWWSDDSERAAGPSDNVAQLGRRSSGWGSSGPDKLKETDEVAQESAGDHGPRVHHPILRLLGPVELVGANGPVPPRAGKQCLEYCGWLLQHPGTTAQAMASALVVAEGTRRSNMSRLRSWLGADGDGQAYLPDAYTGRILLHPSVSSDWQRLQILTGAGINRTSSPGLLAALELVRGAPLADAAPGQWHWAEELRTDMISAVRDIGVELASRALAENDLDLARWAAARALVAAPGDELLMTVRIRTEHQAGHVADTERLTLQLAAQARALGVDLEPETVMLLQEVMEGRVRARIA